MILQNLKLPALLLDMIGTQKWYQPQNLNIVRMMMKGASQNTRIDFLKIEEIDSETTGIKNLFYEYDESENYGLASSKITGRMINDVSVIDADKCLVIIATPNEDFIYLDYRYDNDHPFVSATECIANAHYSHYKVANSFEELVKMAW